MRLHEYVGQTTERWREFRRKEKESAARIEGLVLSLCRCIANGSREQKIETMRSAPEYAELKRLTLSHGSALGLRDGSDRELALWVKVICFGAINAEKSLA